MSPVVCLFMGGPADGERRAIRAAWDAVANVYVPQTFVEVMEEPKLDMHQPIVSTEAVAFKATIYKVHQLREGRETYFVYMPANSRKSIMATLLDGYRKGDQ